MEPTTQVIKGTIEEVFYAGPKFSAGRLRGTDGKSHSFAGNLFATEGQHIALAGRWETHPDYGRQLRDTRGIRRLHRQENSANAAGSVVFVIRDDLRGDVVDRHA